MSKISNIKLTDFRAFKGDINFDFKLSNGNTADLVVIHAPNGMGKTSFFDAVEWGLTGEIHRLKETIDNDEYEGRILKNRYVDNDNPAAVDISCENGSNIIRKTNKRSNKKDYTIGTLTANADIKNYSDWKSLILPHSKIDGFVAATSAEEKFRDWGEFWDADGKSQRSRLTNNH